MKLIALVITIFFSLHSFGNIQGFLTPEQALEIIKKEQNNSNFVIIDVRIPSEFREEHLKKAISIDFYSEIFDNEIRKLSLQNTYLVYCRTGRRSELAYNKLKALGHSNIYNLQGGIFAWKEKGYEVVR